MILAFTVTLYGIDTVRALDTEWVDITSPQIAPYWAETISATVGDYNRDGRPDFFTLQRGFDAKLLLQQPDGAFRDFTASFFSKEKGNWSHASSVVSPDLDEDGRPDLLIAISGVGADYSGSPAPDISKQPRLYLSGGAGFALVGEGWLAPAGAKHFIAASGDDINRIFFTGLSTDRVLASGLNQALRLAVADLDGDRYPEIFVQTPQEARVLWAPSVVGVSRVVTSQTLDSGQQTQVLEIPIAARAFAKCVSGDSNPLCLEPRLKAVWEIGDRRSFLPDSEVFLQNSTGEKIAVRVAEYQMEGGFATGLRFRMEGIPLTWLGQTLRVRARGLFVARRFEGGSGLVVADPRITVADLNGDGRDEILVSDFSRAQHVSPDAVVSAVAQVGGGAFHIYGLNAVNGKFVDWTRVGLPAGEDPLGLQRIAASATAAVALDLDRDGSKEIVLFPGARSDEERLALILEKRQIPVAPPAAQGVGPIEGELYQRASAGRVDSVEQSSFFATDSRGERNSLPKFIRVSTSAAGEISVSRIDQGLGLNLLPTELRQPLDVQSAQVIQDRQAGGGEVERLLLAVGHALPGNRQTVLSYTLRQSPPVLGGRSKCTTSRGEEFPLAALYPGIVAADMNQDGFQDLLHLPVGQAAVHFGNGAGCFQHRNRLPLDARFVKQLVKTDINGDGRPDLVGAIESDTVMDRIVPNARTLLYLNDGRGGFVDASAVLQVPDPKNAGLRRNFTASSVVALDANGDGRQDLLLFGDNALRGHAQLSSQGVHLLLNRGNGLATAPGQPAPPVLESAPNCLPPAFRNWDASSSGAHPLHIGEVADLNRDGKPDIVLSRPKGISNILFNSITPGTEGAACTATCTRDAVTNGSCNRLVLADDELGANPGGADPILSVDVNHKGRKNRLSTLALSDLDRDGLPDIILGSPAGPERNQDPGPPFNVIFRNQIQISPPARFPVGHWRNWFVLQSVAALPGAFAQQEGARCVASADFDGDAKVDLLLAGPAECSSTPGFSGTRCGDRVHAGGLLPGFPPDVWSYPAWGRVLLNSTGANPSAIAFADNDSANQSLAGDMSQYPGTVNHACGTGDFNGDGCVDFFLVQYGFGSVTSTSFGPTGDYGHPQKWYQQGLMNSVYLNSCSRTPGAVAFTRAKSVRNPFKAYSTVIGDFDGDGRDEAVVGGANQMHLFKLK